MTVPIKNPGNFLREQRKFPEEAQPLSVEIDRAYTDIANKMNSRTIGSYGLNERTSNGETWFIGGKKHNGLRKLFAVPGLIPAGSVTIAHGLSLTEIFSFTRIQGTFTNGTNWYPLPFEGAGAAGNIGAYLDPTNIVITAAASAPTISSGYIVLEYLSV